MEQRVVLWIRNMSWFKGSPLFWSRLKYPIKEDAQSLSLIITIQKGKIRVHQWKNRNKYFKVRVPL